MKKAFSSSSFNSNAFLTRLLIHMGLLKVRWKERGPRGGGAGVHQRQQHPGPRVLPGPVTHTGPRPGSA